MRKRDRAGQFSPSGSRFALARIADLRTAAGLLATPVDAPRSCG